MRQPDPSSTFLGFTLRYDYDRNGRGQTFLNVFPPAKSQACAREKLRELTGRHRRSAPIPEVIDEVNRWLVGWRELLPPRPPRPRLRLTERLRSEPDQV